MENKFKVSPQQDIKKRKKLQDIIPLDTPLSMQIELASACNFKCSYCLHSSHRLSNSGFKSGLMDYDLFVKTVDDIKKFPKQLEFISLQSRGESFLNKRLTEMIEYIKKQQVAKEIALNTNAIFLNQEINKRIVQSGLDTIRISIQGVNSQQYKQTSGVDVDFDKLIKNIENLYKNKGNLYIYIKIIDIHLSENDKKKFTEIFSPICDSLFIENPINAWTDAELELTFSNNRYGYAPKRANVCPRLFFAMVVHFDGSVVACDADWEETFILGNVKTDEVVNIWNSDKFNKLRKNHLEGKGRERRLCSECTVIENSEMDNIDDFSDEILKFYR